MAKSREHALSEIASQLRDVYRRDVAHVEHDELAALKPEEAAELTRAMDARSLAFLDYAEKRGPLAARLALLGGFPDSDPTSQLPPARKTRALRNRFEQARSLRDEIAKLDQAYDAQVLDLFKQAGSGTVNARARILREVAGMRAEADRRADQEAAAEVAKEQAELTSLLAERGVVSFPAQAGRTVVVQGSTPLAGPPTVDVPGKAEMEKRQRQALESDLKIWAALKGYVVSSHRRAARDATADFMRWRHSDLGTH